jgi:hypothetical protein
LRALARVRRPSWTLEAAIWTSVVDACPPGHHRSAAQELLRRLVAQAVVCERLEQRLRELRAAGHDSGEDFDVKAHAEAGKQVTSVMTALRGTPRSRTRPRDALNEQGADRQTMGKKA